MNETNEPITPKNIAIDFGDRMALVGEKGQDKENRRGPRDAREQTQNERIIEKIDHMIRRWVAKYKFHTRALASHEKDSCRRFMTEFSNPSSKTPIPEATAIVVFCRL